MKGSECVAPQFSRSPHYQQPEDERVTGLLPCWVEGFHLLQEASPFKDRPSERPPSSRRLAPDGLDDLLTGCRLDELKGVPNVRGHLIGHPLKGRGRCVRVNDGIAALVLPTLVWGSAQVPLEVDLDDVARPARPQCEVERRGAVPVRPACHQRASAVTSSRYMPASSSTFAESSSTSLVGDSPGRAISSVACETRRRRSTTTSGEPPRPLSARSPRCS